MRTGEVARLRLPDHIAEAYSRRLQFDDGPLGKLSVIATGLDIAASLPGGLADDQLPVVAERFAGQVGNPAVTGIIIKSYQAEMERTVV